MFFRGQRIKILESTFYGKRHPKAGDEGFIRELFFLVEHRLLLVEMVLFKTTSGYCKPVRKKFIVNLDMKPSVTNHILNNGLSLFTSRPSPRSVCINILAQLVDGHVSSEALPNALETWQNWYIHKRALKIPICTFKTVTRVVPVNSQNKNELTAWLISMTPIVVSLLCSPIYTGKSIIAHSYLLYLRRYIYIQDSPRHKMVNTHFIIKQSVADDIYRNNNTEVANRLITAIKFATTTVDTNIIDNLINTTSSKRARAGLSDSEIKLLLLQGSSHICHIEAQPPFPDTTLDTLKQLNILAIYTLFRRTNHARIIDYLRYVADLSYPKLEDKINSIHTMAIHDSVALSRFYELSFPNIT